jgi:hypothetical protein
MQLITDFFPNISYLECLLRNWKRKNQGIEDVNNLSLNFVDDRGLTTLHPYDLEYM